MALSTLKAIAVHRSGDGDLGDGGGLFVKIRDGVARAAFRYTSPAGVRRETGLGLLDRSSLAATGESLVRVRAAAAKARKLLDDGFDPIETKRADREREKSALEAKKAQAKAEATTLARHARRFHEAEIEPDPKMTELHKRHWIASLENHVPATLWHAPIAEIDAPWLLRELATIRSLDDKTKRIPETLSRIRQRLEMVFEDALFHGLVTANPAQAIRRKMRQHVAGRKGKGLKFLPYVEVPAFMRRVREQQGTAGRALEFAMLTASRTGEVLGAVWSEIDLDASTWTVPAERMKGGVENGDHVVHLSKAAKGVLAAVEGLDPVVVFPSPVLEKRPLSNMAMLAVLDRLDMRDKTTVHGVCRKSFSTWANENGVARPDAIEAALAHREADVVRRAYNHAQFTAERRALLDAWADYCDGKTPANNVVPIKDAA